MRDSRCELVSRRPSLLSPGPGDKMKESVSSCVVLQGRVSSLGSSCRICLAALRSPAALTCGHRFCERCLDQYWRVGEKPPCIVCPLCRACAFNVNFAKENKSPSSDDFRRTFSPIVVKELDISNAIVWCAKISALMPVIYFLLKWLKPPVLQVFKNLYLTLASKM